VNDGELVERISDALHRAWDGRVIKTEIDQLLKDVARMIPDLRSARNGEHEWLAQALLRAAESGRLSEVVTLSAGERPINPHQYRVAVAYAEVHSREGRPPLIGELLRELGIDKPKDDRERSVVNNRERVIRKTLKAFGLPLSAGKRGRPCR
jgi:hypothetical protein